MAKQYEVAGLVRDDLPEGDAFYRLIAGPIPGDFSIPEELKDLCGEVQRPNDPKDPACRIAECPMCFGLKVVPTKYGARPCTFCGGSGEAPGLVKMLISERIPRPDEMEQMLSTGKPIFPKTTRMVKALFGGEKLPFPIYHCLLVRPSYGGTKYKGSAVMWMRPDGVNLQRHEDRQLGEVLIAYHAVAAHCTRTHGEFRAEVEYTAPMDGGVKSESIGVLYGTCVDNTETGKKEWGWEWKQKCSPNFIRVFAINEGEIVARIIERGLPATGWEPKV